MSRFALLAGAWAISIPTSAWAGKGGTPGMLRGSAGDDGTMNATTANLAESTGKQGMPQMLRGSAGDDGAMNATTANLTEANGTRAIAVPLSDPVMSMSSNGTSAMFVASMSGTSWDTPNWNNGWTRCANEPLGSNRANCIPGQGWTCAGYVAKGWCAHDQCLPPSQTSGVYACGKNLNYPDQNCAACGKPSTPARTTCSNEGCGGNYISGNSCQCTYDCEQYGTCCSDYWQQCSRPSCINQYGSCGDNGRQTGTCCSGLQCQQLLGGYQMQCVEPGSACIAQYGSCGDNGYQTGTCCSGLQCQQLIGGYQMQCVQGGPTSPSGSWRQMQWANDPSYCLSVDASTFQDGQNVQLWKCSHSSGQLFNWNVGTDGLIRVSQDPNFCVVIDGDKNQNGANIQLWRCDTSNHYMRWHTQSVWGHDLVVNSNGRCMTVDNNRAFNGANVQLWDCAGRSESLRTWIYSA